MKTCNLLAILGCAFLIGVFVWDANNNQVDALAHSSGAHATAHTSVHATPHVTHVTPHTAPHVTPHVNTPHVSTHTTTPHTTTPHTSVGVHSSTHTSVSNPHASVSTHTNVNTSHSAISHGTLNASRVTTSKPLSKANVSESVRSSLPDMRATSRSIARAQDSTFYRSLNSGMHQTDFVFWNTYCDTYYMRPYYYYYPWMPFWMFNSSNKQVNTMKNEVRRKKMGWIRIGSKLIAVPLKLYNKIKVGDTVELTDNTHIKINGKTYEK
uniref:hypothetical protein n=1 Tax=Lactobacillus acidophilus TaxID=1579 RepID=UPI003F57DF78